MASHYRNHHTLLQYRVQKSGAAPIFKIPVINGLAPPTQWTNVSFSQFFADVNTVAHFLAASLQENDIPPRSTIGLWFSGSHYIDFVYIIALSRASYVPQVFGISLTSTVIIRELMEKGGAKAIIYEPSLEPLMQDFSCAKLQIIPVYDCTKTSINSGLPDLEDLPSEDEFCFIFHTSGSTSGSPKLVPLTPGFIRTVYSKFEEWGQGNSSDTQNVFNQLGSVAHAATMYVYTGVVYTGACIVQPSTPRFSTTELSNMVKACGLNRISLFSTFLSIHIKVAREDAKVLKLLQGMRSITYGGASLQPEDEDWGYENRIPLMNTYANTECTLLMSSTLGQHPRLLRPISTVSHRFEPVGETSQVDNSGGIQLYEFVVLADSPDIPQPHLLSYDGNFHTGDLFEKKENGYYVFRGRDDDWIKNDATKRCDTKSIEDKLRDLCSDVMKDCVVVGTNRPSPALFIERPSSAPHTLTDDQLKTIILDRMKEFNDRRYLHERVTDARLVFVVQEGTLPRTTKGNIRRKAIEELRRKELDDAYALVYA